MNKKVSSLIVVVILIILVVGGFLIFHKAKKTTTASTSSTSSSSHSASVSNAVVQTKTSSSLGQYLTDPNGRALYTSSQDTSGVSNCTGSCLSTWPPYFDVGSTTGLPTNVSTIKRTDDGRYQYTYKGLPLYYFSSDTKAGQVTGNGVGGFQTAKP